MPAKPAAKKTPPKPAKPVVKPKVTAKAKAAPAKVSAAARAKAAPKPKAPVRAQAVKVKEPVRAKPQEIIRAKPKEPVKRLTAAERAEMKKYREALVAERTRLLVELEEIESRTARSADAERATELSSYEDHPADLASETFEREKDLAIAESVESLFNQVNTALEKVERGTYGVCDACGRPIKKARLQALPFATLCLECQGRLEG